MPSKKVVDPKEKPDTIVKIFARTVLDSRGNPTIEAELSSPSQSGRAIVPSGASTGSHEALELRDNEKTRFHGKGVKKAVYNINSVIAKAIQGTSALNQEALDDALIKLDGTPNKARLGANAILAVSLADAHLAAAIEGVPLYEHIGAPFHAKEQRWVLPVPFANVINGGAHAGNKLSIQEFMVVPTGAQDFYEAVRMVSEVYYTLRQLLKDKYGKTAINVGDEGGFAPPLAETQEALEALIRAVEESGYGIRSDFFLAIDAAANEFKSGAMRYIINNRELSSLELLDFYIDLTRTYPIISIEDPFHEDDFASFKSLTAKIGSKVQIVGDDLTVTNPERIQRAISEEAITALLLKVNQIGTLTEAIRSARLCLDNKPKHLGVMVSHRSGETEDVTISHLVVGLRAAQIKLGGPARGERTAKYNELIRISDRLGTKGVYAGQKFRTPWEI